MNKALMMDYVYRQLAIDYNCEPSDFMREGLIFTEAIKNEGRRPWPWVTPRLEMISMGSGVIINASSDILPYVHKQLVDRSFHEAFSMPFVYGVNQYFLPDIEKISKLDMPIGFEYEIVEKGNIRYLYEITGFDYVLQYDINSSFPEMLIILARDKNKVIGMAGANVDCENMREINVDVLLPYRGKGIASALVNILTIEILNR